MYTTKNKQLEINNSVYSHRTLTNEGIKQFTNAFEWFRYAAATDLQIDPAKGYIDITKTKKSLLISLKDINTNKPVKKLLYVRDITENFIQGYDGLYYNEAWSKKGDKIEIDGLGFTIEKVMEYYLEYEAINNILDKIEIEKDVIRKYFI